jgi:hypothetical protein
LKFVRTCKFSYGIIDPVTVIDEGEKWNRLFSNVLLDGRPVQADD